MASRAGSSLGSGAASLQASAVPALQRAIGNRGVQQLLQRRPAPKQPPRRALPPLRVQLDESRGDGAAWKIEFDEWVFRHQLVNAIFTARALPDGFTLEPTRKSDGNPTLQWTLSWRGRMTDHLDELTEFGKRMRERANHRGGEELTEDRWRREAAEEAARVANREHNKTPVPALGGMTGGEALAKLKPGIYVAAPDRPLRPIPAPNADDSLSDVTWMRDYAKGGVFVWVGGTTTATSIDIREIGSHEVFWKWMVWYMQRGRTLRQAEKEYIELWDELNRTMIGAFALALSSAPRIGPRQNVVKPSAVGRGTPRNAAPAPKPAIRHVDPLAAVETALQGYGMAQMVKDTIEGAIAMEEAKAAHERGDLYQLPLIVSDRAALEDPEGAPVAAKSLQRAPVKPARGGSKRKLSVRERVEAFANDLAKRYREEIAAARKANPKATHSLVGILGEKKTLEAVGDLAKKWKLDPNKIWVGDFPAGVTGPKGGVITTEIGSTFYKFMLELKKSPRAVRAHQAQAHLVGIEHTANFPRGGRYYRVYGEGFKPGAGTFRYEAAPPAKPPKARRR